MTTYTVKPNQCMCDVVLNACGTLEAAYAVCAANDVPLSASVAQGTLTVGQSIIIPGTDEAGNPVPVDKSALDYLAGGGVVIGTDTRLVCGLVVGLGQSGPSTSGTIGILFNCGSNYSTGAQVSINTVNAPGATLISVPPDGSSSPLVHYTFTGLTSGTTYYIYVRTVCDAGSTASGYSGWSYVVAATA